MADFAGIRIGNQGTLRGLWVDEGGTLYTYVQLFGSQLAGGTPPTVTFVQPTPGQALPSTGSTIIVEVTDVDGIAALCMLVEFASGAYEVIHDGTRFASRFAVGSTRNAIPNGYRFNLVRSGGWYEDVTIRVLAVDSGGGVA